MINAKNELLKYLGGEMPLCARIDYAKDFETTETILLKKWYSEDDWEDFLSKLDFQYDNGFGTQHLFGIVWISESVWIERNEYDGAESWAWQECPEIPSELL